MKSQDHLCPLCLSKNDCAAVTDPELNVSCWCQSVEIKPSTLAQVADQVGTNACLCIQCVKQLLSQEHTKILDNIHPIELGIRPN